MKNTNDPLFITPTGWCAIIQSILRETYYWRLFLEGKKQRAPTNSTAPQYDECNFGYIIQEAREPGRFKLLHDVARKLYTPENINQPLDLNQIIAMHSDTYVKGNNFMFAARSDAKRSIPLTDKSKIPALNALAKKYISDDKKLPWEIENDQVLALWNIDQVNKNVPRIIAAYEEQVNDKTLTALVKLQKIFELREVLLLIHIFTNNNARIMDLILNKELIKHDFTPIIRDNHDSINCNDLTEIHNTQKSGEENFLSVFCAQHTIPNGVDNQVIYKNIYQILVDSTKVQELKNGTSVITQFNSSIIEGLNTNKVYVVTEVMEYKSLQAIDSIIELFFSAPSIKSYLNTAPFLANQVKVKAIDCARFYGNGEEKAFFDLPIQQQHDYYFTKFLPAVMKIINSYQNSTDNLLQQLLSDDISNISDVGYIEVRAHKYLLGDLPEEANN